MNQRIESEHNINATSKEALRIRYREIRKRHHGITQLIPTLTTHLEEILSLREGDATWGLYKSHQSELNLSVAVESLRPRWPLLRWAYPRITPKNSLEFFVPREDQWLPNSFSILEPNPETAERVTLSQFAGVFVPGLAFDRFGNRIGSGKGFYDRALSEFRGLRVGVGYSVQISDDPFPTEQHDIQMDFLLTEQGVVKCERFQSESSTKG